MLLVAMSVCLIVSWVLLLWQEECNRCQSCKRRKSTSGERTHQCTLCGRSWHESCALALSSDLTQPEVLAGFTEEHGHLLQGLRSCFVRSLKHSGIDDVWSALTSESTASASSSAESQLPARHAEVVKL